MLAWVVGGAAAKLSGTVDELLRRTGRPTVGAVGFCMGGGLALVRACQRPDAVAAVVPAYGVIPWPDARPDYSTMRAAVSRSGQRTGEASTSARLGNRVTAGAFRSWIWVTEARTSTPAAANRIFEILGITSVG